jgi:hypothetical protein
MGAETNDYCTGESQQQSNQPTTHLILLWDITCPANAQSLVS